MSEKADPARGLHAPGGSLAHVVEQDAPPQEFVGKDHVVQHEKSMFKHVPFGVELGGLGHMTQTGDLGQQFGKTAPGFETAERLPRKGAAQQ